jgi:hypothetical protein
MAELLDFHHAQGLRDAASQAEARVLELLARV